MSYNIDSVRYLSGKLSIRRDAALAFEDEHQDDLPESNFFQRIVPRDPEVREIKHPSWSGSGSGRPGLFEAALALTTGEAELLLVWEGGDSVTGLHVKDGVVTKKQVKYVLTD